VSFVHDISGTRSMQTADYTANFSRASRKEKVTKEGGGVVTRVSDLGSKGPGFDPRTVPKSECMFVNIYHY